MRREISDLIDGAWYDYASAEDMLRAGRYNYVAFLCQQAVEKMLKAAVMARTRTRYPKAHNLKELLDETGLTVPGELETAILRLGPHYLASRYLNAAGGRPWELYNSDLAQGFLTEAKSVLEWLESKTRSSE